MIFDCFQFFNELDLLELRLNELSPIVDIFVLSEATLTFTGKKKPLYYLENKERFHKFSDKIHHIVIDSYDNVDTSDAWAMDRWQKQVGVDFLQNNFRLNEYDAVILSDCDEIPKAKSIKKFLKKDFDTLTLKMQMFYYYMNLKGVRNWYFSKIIRPRKDIVLSKIRGKKAKGMIRDAGWHFSYLGSIKYKLDSFAHTEYNKPPFNEIDWIKEKVTAGEDLFGREKMKFDFLTDLDYLPEYVKKNIWKYKKYFKTRTIDII